MKKIFLPFLLAAAVFAAPVLFSQTNTEVLKTEALQQMKQGRYGEAIDLLNRYISAFPRRADGYNLRGLCYEKRAQYEMAVYDFRSARKLEPDNKEIQQNLSRTTDAWYALLLNKIEGHRREIAINPAKAVNYLEIGKSYKHMGEWLVAEEWYDKYLEREEASADEIIRYSEILAKNNHISKGEPILKRYCEKYPNDHRLWSRYGYFTLWLGKNQIAIRAFTNALELRPFFKEALDGLDLARGRGYIYIVNDTSSRFNYGLPVGTPEYAIDKYYRIIRQNPGDEESRMLLVKELMKANRLEEAYSQLQILAATKSDDEEFQKFWDEVMDYRKQFYSDQIDDLKAKLEKSPYDRDAILKIGQYYSYNQQYDKAASLYEFYLKQNPRDHEIRYNLALISAWNKDLTKARDEADIILSDDPSNTRYQLLRGQLSAWLNEDLDKGEALLKKVVSKEPDNLSALITLGTLMFQKHQFEESVHYANLAEKIDPSDVELLKLKYILDLQEQRNEEAARYAVLETARTHAYNEDCEEAIGYYNEYLSFPEADQSVRNELAQAHICLKDYISAIKIYDDLLKEDYDFELDKQRAKVYFWSGDSIKALAEFERLYASNPDDAEVQLYLGDSYMQMKKYDEARKIYREMLEVSPGSQIVQMRLGWLGEGPGVGIPTYVLITPEASYYTDNLDLKLNTQGLRIEAGLTRFLAIAVSGQRGGLSSATDRLNFNTIKGNVFLTLNRYITLGGAFGKTFFSNNIQSETAEGFLRASQENRYLLTVGVNSSDAALLLYSPYLVTNRLTATHLFAAGEYFFESGMLLKGKYAHIAVSDNNDGNNIEFRVGKKFDPELTAGYEYNHLSFENLSPLYWSPDNYESHSVWADWMVYEEKPSKITIGGKFGLIPESNYILREIYGAASMKLAEQFTLQARITAGSTVQQKIGYSSTSLNISAFWTL